MLMMATLVGEEVMVWRRKWKNERRCGLTSSGGGDEASEDPTLRGLEEASATEWELVGMIPQYVIMNQVSRTATSESLITLR